MSDLQFPKEVITGLTNINTNTIELPPAEIPQKIIEGSPTAGMQPLWESEDGTQLAAVWSNTVGRWEIEWPWEEVMYLIEGQLELTDHLGNSHMMNPGDFYHARKGTKHMWNTIKPIKKLMIIMHDAPIADHTWD
jgi:uncharacterized protein